MISQRPRHGGDVVLAFTRTSSGFRLTLHHLEQRDVVRFPLLRRERQRKSVHFQLLRLRSSGDLEPEPDPSRKVIS